MRNIRTNPYVLVVWMLLARGASAEFTRSIPAPLPAHPGNIFLAGEKIVVASPPGEVATWRAVNYEGKTIANGPLKDGQAEVGTLPVGWYKIVRGEGHITNRTFICVLAPLRAPTPATSPIGIDVAMAWMYPKERMGDVVNLCQLAGISRVRDRLAWQPLEPKRGEFSGPNQYDDSARIQHEGGLQILQVNHLSPSWSNPDARRFPPDLRDLYNFFRAMAQRWTVEVGAFEPWNEADIKMFGGHTGSEMASLQKAAYLGLKTGNPKVIACQNVFAIRRAATLGNFQENEATAYFDTYNLHTYEALSNYPAVYAAHRAGSGGKPMWVTECSVHVKWRGDEQLRELGDEDLRLQSERLTKTYALAIHEGVQAIFYFMLPHYTETKLQYGLLRPDLTPRPGYVALAAVGRLLADAKPLGQVAAKNESVHAYVFRAKPDGKTADVLVAWAVTNATLELPKPPRACYDHLSRVLHVTNSVLPLSTAPIYAVLEKGASLPLLPLPKSPKLSKEKPGVVVIQAILPENETVVDKSAYKIQAGQTKIVPVFLYNFGEKNLRGHLRVTASTGLKAELTENVELAPGDRKELALTLTSDAGVSLSEANVRITGDFGASGHPVLAMRFVSQTD